MARDYGKNKFSGKNEPKYVENLKGGLQDYERMRLEAEEKLLDLHQKLNNELEKQWFTSEKLTKSENSRIKYLESEMKVRMNTNNLLGKSSQTKKQVLKYSNDELKVLQKILKSRKNTNSLVDDYIQLQHDIERRGSKALSDDDKASAKRKSNILAEEIAWRRTEEVRKKTSKKLLDTFESMGPVVKSLSKLVQNIVSDPLTSMMTIMKFGVSSFTDFSTQMDGIGNQFGSMGFQSKGVQKTLGKILRDGASLDIEMREISQVLPSISSHFGLSQEASLKLSENIIRTGRSLGISGNESEKLYDILNATHGLGAEALSNTLAQQASWAETQGVVPSTVIRQLASNTEFVAKNTKDMGEEMLNTAISASKLGIELSTIGKMQGKLLDFQSSIRSEFELSVLLGKQVNLTQARGMMLSGDTASATKSVVDQLQGIDLKSLDVLTFQKIGETIGMSGTEIQKAVNRGGELNTLVNATAQDLSKMDVSDINAENAVSETTKLKNNIKNASRMANEQLVDNFDRGQMAVSGLNAALSGTLGALNSIGIATGVFVGSLAMAIRFATQLNTQLRMAAAAPSSVTPGRNNYSGKSSAFSLKQMYRGWKNVPTKGSGEHLFHGGSKPPRQTVNNSYMDYMSGGNGGGGRNTKHINNSGPWANTKGLFKKGGMKNFSKSLRGKGGAATIASLGLMLASGGMPKDGADIGGLLGGMGGAAAGAAIGSMIFPGVGTAIGGLLGGMLGDSGGSAVGGMFHTGTGHVPKTGIYGLQKGEAVIPNSVNAVSSMGGISSIRPGNNGIDYDRMAAAVERGNMNYAKNHGVPTKSDYQLDMSAQRHNDILTRAIA